MLIEKLFKNGYQVLRFKEELAYQTNVGEIQNLIDETVQSGTVNIAIAFLPTDHLYTPPIRILVKSYQAVSSKGGRLALITPAEDLVEEIEGILKILGLFGRILVLRSEDQLLP